MYMYTRLYALIYIYMRVSIYVYIEIYVNVQRLMVKKESNKVLKKDKIYHDESGNSHTVLKYLPISSRPHPHVLLLKVCRKSLVL